MCQNRCCPPEPHARAAGLSVRGFGSRELSQKSIPWAVLCVPGLPADLLLAVLPTCFCCCIAHSNPVVSHLLIIRRPESSALVAAVLCTDETTCTLEMMSFFAFLSQQSTGLVTKRPVTVSEGTSVLWTGKQITLKNTVYHAAGKETRLKI